MGRIKTILFGALPFVCLLGVWYLVSRYSLLPDWFIPTPGQTFDTFLLLSRERIIEDLILTSLSNLMPPFLLAFLVSVLLGLFIGANRTAKKIFFPLFSSFYAIPGLVWLPFIIFFLGFTQEAVWCVIFISSFSRMLYSVIGGAQSINPKWLLVSRNLGFSRFETIIEVILPAIFPHLIIAARLGFGSAWRSLVGAEMLLLSIGGLGSFIWSAQWFFAFDKVVIGIFIIALFSLFMEKLVFAKLEVLIIRRWGLEVDDYTL